MIAAVLRRSNGAKHFRGNTYAFLQQRFLSAEIRDQCSEFIELCNRYEGDGSVDLVRDDNLGYAEIVLNNPAKRNALTGKMMLQLETAVTELETWKGRALFLYGAKHTFCSGGDLGFVKTIATPELGYQMNTFMQHTLERLGNLPLVSVCIIRGAAHGGGAELTTATDFRVLCRTGEVRFVQAKLGITTGWGGATRLARIIGPMNAFSYLASCSPINISNSHGLGFSSLITKDLEGVDMAKTWYQDNFYKQSPEAIKRYKKLTRAFESDPSQSFALERDLFKETWGSPSHVAAIDAVLNKTPSSS